MGAYRDARKYGRETTASYWPGEHRPVVSDTDMALNVYEGSLSFGPDVFPAKVREVLAHRIIVADSKRVVAAQERERLGAPLVLACFATDVPTASLGSRHS